MMDGRIWVVSDSANGSTFHFTVRLELQAKVPERKQLIDASQLRNVSVLVVDDNFTNRKVLEGMLSRWGIISTCVDGGRAGLEEIARAGDAGHPFHLVIVDGQMPDMDGFAFVEQIQSRSMGGSITIMMLTSAGHLGDAARCRELGISAYLVKPVRQTELLESICRVLQNSPQTTKPDLVTRHTVREDQHRLKILLAEDNLVNQTLAVRLLEKRGYTVTVTSNGRQAVELFDRQSFDLVLMDVQMPEMDGFAATAAIRGIEKLRGTHVPIIAMTAHALKGDQQRCLAAGMDNYISKPIRTGEFFAMIEDLAGRYKVGSVNTAGEDPHHLLKVLE
jgi:CheY-like chemotaxis protein